VAHQAPPPLGIHLNQVCPEYLRGKIQFAPSRVPHQGSGSEWIICGLDVAFIVVVVGSDVDMFKVLDARLCVLVVIIVRLACIFVGVVDLWVDSDFVSPVVVLFKVFVSLLIFDNVVFFSNELIELWFASFIGVDCFIVATVVTRDVSDMILSVSVFSLALLSLPWFSVSFDFR